MIQIRVEINELKSGKISIESKMALCKKTELTKSEIDVANKIKKMFVRIMKDIFAMLPDSQLATNAEDVETLKGMEDLYFFDQEDGKND